MPSDGKWDLFRNRHPFYKPCSIKSFAVANYDSTITKEVLQNFFGKLLNEMGERGWSTWSARKNGFIAKDN